MPYHSIDDPTKLRRVLEAVLLIERDLELPALLRHVIEEAASMTGARYAAVGVLNEDRTALAEFVTFGMEPAQVARIGPLPTGKGVLGALIANPKPLRLTRLGDHPDSFGFPPDHPPMTSFLGVPVKVRDEVYGNLYLTDKVGWSEFTNDDVALVEALAVAAGVAIENARLHQQVQVAAVYDDRDRLARDLHDHVIQRLFGMGLALQGLAARATPDISAGLQKQVNEADEIISEVRATIYALGMGGSSRGSGTTSSLWQQSCAPQLGLIDVAFDGAVNTAISETVADHVMAIIREAVTNVERHAQATRATISLSAGNGCCQLVIADDGRGFSGEAREGGLGLTNLRRRAEKLSGRFDISGAPTGGTVLTWRVPITE